MNILLNFLKIFPYVFGGIVAVETAFPTAPGTTKKEIVLSSLAAAAQVGEQVPVPVVQQFSFLIDAVVGVLNKTGLFKHQTAAPATPALPPV